MTRNIIKVSENFRNFSQQFQFQFVFATLGFETQYRNMNECLSCSSARGLMWIIDRKSKTYGAFTRFTQSWVHFIPIETGGGVFQRMKRRQQQQQQWTHWLYSNTCNFNICYASVLKIAFCCCSLKQEPIEADFLWCHHSPSVAYIS